MEIEVNEIKEIPVKKDFDYSKVIGRVRSISGYYGTLYKDSLFLVQEGYENSYFLIHASFRVEVNDKITKSGYSVMIGNPKKEVNRLVILDENDHEIKFTRQDFDPIPVAESYVLKDSSLLTLIELELGMLED